MTSEAEPKLRSMYATDRDRWQADCKLIEMILRRISQRGVR